MPQNHYIRENPDFVQKSHFSHDKIALFKVLLKERDF